MNALRSPVSPARRVCCSVCSVVCCVSSRDQPLPFLSGLRKASLEPSVSQAAKCIGEEEQGNLELMSVLQEETEGWDATQTDCTIWNCILYI